MNRYTIILKNWETIDVYADYTEIFRAPEFHLENICFCRFEGRYKGENVAIINREEVMHVRFERV